MNTNVRVRTTATVLPLRRRAPSRPAPTPPGVGGDHAPGTCPDPMACPDICQAAAWSGWRETFARKGGAR